MAKKQVTISVYVKEELRERFEEVFQESEFNSKGEFFGVLMENYLKPAEGSRPEELTKVRELQQTISDLRAEIRVLERNRVNEDPLPHRNEAHVEDDSDDAPDMEGLIVLSTTPEQYAILHKCYDEKDEFEQEIIKDLVRMAMSWVKVRKSGLFSDEEHSRLFSLKGITPEEFESAFRELVAAIETS